MEKHIRQIISFDSDCDEILNESNSKKFHTFWSLEKTYQNNHLRYHAGQIAMISIMNKLAKSKGCFVTATLCDTDDIFLNANNLIDERDIDTSLIFINTLTDMSIRAKRLTDSFSRNESQKLIKNSSQYMATIKVIDQFRREILKNRDLLNDYSLQDLKKYRFLNLHLETPDTLHHIVTELKKVFNLPDYLLLSSLYAFTYRPSWFSSTWLTDVVIYLSNLPNQIKTNNFILEADRNAYSWLLAKTIYLISREEFDYQNTAWPIIACLKSLPSISGKTYMNVDTPEECIFLDEATISLNKKIINLDAKTRKIYNEIMFDNIEYDNKSDWDNRYRATLEQAQEKIFSLIQKKSFATIAKSLHQNESYDFFISYNSLNYEIANDFKNILDQNNITCFLDKEKLKPHGIIDDDIKQALLSSNGILFLADSTCGISEWQSAEASFCVDMVKENPKFKIISLSLHNIEEDKKKLHLVFQTRLVLPYYGNEKDSTINKIKEYYD